eukprot:scaffold60783_cov62-Cyclotella_meneghiniana.AAC.1
MFNSIATSQFTTNYTLLSVRADLLSRDRRQPNPNPNLCEGGGGVVNAMQWTKSPNSAKPVRLRLRTVLQLLTGIC